MTQLKLKVEGGEEFKISIKKESNLITNLFFNKGNPKSFKGL